MVILFAWISRCEDFVLAVKLISLYLLLFKMNAAINTNINHSKTGWSLIHYIFNKLIKSITYSSVMSSRKCIEWGVYSMECEKTTSLTALIHIWAGVPSSAHLWRNLILDIPTFRKIAHDVKHKAWCLATRRAVSRQRSDKCDWSEPSTCESGRVCSTLWWLVASQRHFILCAWSSTHLWVI